MNLFMIWFWLGLILPISLSANEGQWEKMSDEDGIEVFKKEVPGSPILAMRGQGKIDASISKVASVLLDATRATEWVDSLVEVRILNRPSEKERLEWNHVRTPFVMKDRDFVLITRIEEDLKTKTLTLKIKSTEDPLAPKTDFVRGEIKDSSFVLKAIGTEQTYVIAEIQADPKGDVAKWIVNLFQKNWPRNTLESLRKQSKKSSVQESLYYKKLFLIDSKN